MMDTAIECISPVRTDGGAYPFKINYSKINNIGMGNSVNSPTFTMGGHEWCISVYPQGYDEEDRGAYVSIYLDLLCECKEVSVIFDFFLSHKCGWRFPFTRRGRNHKTHQPGNSWCNSQVIKRTDLEARCIDANGCFVIFCMIKVEGGSCERVPEWRSIGISHYFRKIFEEGDMTNVMFEVLGESFAAHRVVLAERSPVFKAELLGSMAESGHDMNPIVIQDMQPTVFKFLLHFIYTDSIPRINDKKADIIMTQHLLVAADRYAVEGLKLMCEEKLCNNVSLDTVTSSLSIADRHNFSRLKNTCLEFVAVPKNILRLMLNKEYIDLIHHSSSLVAEIEAKTSQNSDFLKIIEE